MQKPSGYDEATTMGNQKEAINLGGHHLIIKQVTETVSSTNKPMIVVAFDIEEGSASDGFYRRMHDNKKKFDAGAKWQGVIRYMLYGKDGVSTNGFFKGFIGAVEESNPGFTWNWDERSVAGKLVGMVFGEEEYRKQDGNIGTSVKAQQARSVQAIRDGVEVPAKKVLNDETQGYAPYDPAAGFTQAEGKLPWET